MLLPIIVGVAFVGMAVIAIRGRMAGSHYFCLLTAARKALVKVLSRNTVNSAMLTGISTIFNKRVAWLPRIDGFDEVEWVYKAVEGFE